MKPALVLLVLALVPAGEYAQAPATGHEVSGIVVGSLDGEGVPAAHLSLHRTRDGKLTADTTSDAQGRFTFTAIADGKYELTAVKKGYITIDYQQHAGGISTAIVTGERAVSTGLRFGIPPEAKIFGQVKEDSGDPVPRASVSLFRRNPYVPTQDFPMGGAQADAMGNFEISGLAEGIYFACAIGTPWYSSASRPRAQFRGQQQPKINDPERIPLDVAYAPTCYPDVTDSAQAAAIHVGPGDRLPVNITMHPWPALHIVTEIPHVDQKHPFNPPQFSAELFGFPEYLQAPVYVTPTNQEENPSTTDSVEIAGIAAGRYRLSMSSATEGSRAMEVELSAEQPDLDLSAAKPLAELTGQVTMAGDEGIPPGMHIWISPQHGSELILEVHSDGSFKIETLTPGDYTISVRTPQGFPFALMRIDAQGARVRGHSLRTGNQPIRLTLNVNGTTATINGIAQRGTAPISGVFVALAPTDLKEMSSLVQLNQSDSDGTFNFTHIPPGDYTVMAIEEGWNLDWVRPESVTPFLSGGVRVTVTGREREVDLPSPVELQPRR